MENIYLDLRAKLIKLAEPEYQKFTASLIPNADNILGVRTPVLRKHAKELARDNWREYFELNEDVYSEETMLQGMAIGYLKEDFETVLNEVRKFLPKIHNWAVCDSFCVGLRPIVNKNKERMWVYLLECIETNKPYYIRFAVVMIMNCYIDDEHASDAFGLFDRIKNDDYYVKMAVAWAVSMFYVQLSARTMEYLHSNKLDNFTYNKALQKICESLKPSHEEKAVIKSMKRRAGNRD